MPCCCDVTAVIATMPPDDGESSLPAFLAARARRASDTRLALDVAGGLLAGIFGAWLRPPGWFLLCAAAACFLAYGAWGIADRELRERESDAGTGAATPMLRGARAAAVVMGALAALALIFGTAGFVLGTIIS